MNSGNYSSPVASNNQDDDEDKNSNETFQNFVMIAKDEESKAEIKSKTFEKEKETATDSKGEEKVKFTSIFKKIKDNAVPEKTEDNKDNILDFDRFKKRKVEEKEKDEDVDQESAKKISKIHKKKSNESLKSKQYNINDLRICEINSDTKTWKSICRGNLIITKSSMEAEYLQVVIRDGVAKHVLFNGVISKELQDLKIERTEKSSSLKIVMSRVDNETGSMGSLEMFLMQSSHDKIINLLSYLNELMRWDSEQEEVDDAYEEFLKNVK
ncbi:MAG: hypothetical protein MHMPM18_001169 [Marteilia pararefringens]